MVTRPHTHTQNAALALLCAAHWPSLHSCSSNTSEPCWVAPNDPARQGYMTTPTGPVVSHRSIISIQQSYYWPWLHLLCKTHWNSRGKPQFSACPIPQLHKSQSHWHFYPNAPKRAELFGSFWMQALLHPLERPMLKPGNATTAFYLSLFRSQENVTIFEASQYPQLKLAARW